MDAAQSGRQMVNIVRSLLGLDEDVGVKIAKAAKKIKKAEKKAKKVEKKAKKVEKKPVRPRPTFKRPQKRPEPEEVEPDAE